MVTDSIFNLMNTNGRRNDVLNALKIYLEVLEEIKSEYPTESWNSYPESIAQYVFYVKALEKSKDVFKVHKKFDSFSESISDDFQQFIDKDNDWIDSSFLDYKKVLDESIEQRSRHYTSNLVKMGFTDSDRNITEAGYSYLRGSVSKDLIEQLLPLDSINIILLRQLLKLKIFSYPDENGNRKYYSPVLMAFMLLLSDENIDLATFELIVQGLSPYSSDEIKSLVYSKKINAEELENKIKDITIEIPYELQNNEEIDFDVFKKYFKSSKSSVTTSKKFFKFYKALLSFKSSRKEADYNALILCYEENSELLKKAFGYGKTIFKMGNKGNRYNLDRFLSENADHTLLKTNKYNEEFYRVFAISKWIDGIREYSDTTIRLLNATGIFKFSNLPELSYREILTSVFDIDILKNSIFGEMTDSEFCSYENSENCYFSRNTSICQILALNQNDVETIVNKVTDILGTSDYEQAQKMLQDKKSIDFVTHVSEKYPKEKILEILPLFSDRKNDSKIKIAVNDSASVPTIYEYIVGIAWYYISDQKFDLYRSLNLTLDANFEPVIHAGGGEGDIIINYADLVVMLEVTLMNKQAQKRGEWEPVLRHSLNLKANNKDKDTITFFIADELDYNTINIWRAVAAVPLESTNNHDKVDGVVIMPFTNLEIIRFLEENVNIYTIIEETKISFEEIPKITDTQWREKVMGKISN